MDVEGLGALIALLCADGYTVIGPVVRDGTVVPTPVTSLSEMARGVVDHQGPGTYRLHADGDLLFGYAAAATGWKRYLFPAHRPLWRYDRNGSPTTAAQPIIRQALFGVRSCDLHALQVLDTVLAGRRYVDADYAARRAATFVVAVTCAHPAATCFCASMSTGPAPQDGFDLLITELVGERGHRFLVESGTPLGRAVLERLPAAPATPGDDADVATCVSASVATMERVVDTEGIRDLLYASANSPRWDDVAARCLSCTNCTLVCPTCFCFTTEDVVGLSGADGRDRMWDSCFNADHSLLHGGAVRRSTRARYRQWVTHKFGSWIDQFGVSGCVGCGRCIAWCPAGIDVTEELAAIRAAAEQTAEDAP